MRYVIRDHYDCLQKFQGSPSFWFGQIDLLKINDFWKILFSQTLTLMFSYWLIECLQLNQMFVTSFIDFIAKCYWTKLHNMAKIMDFLMFGQVFFRPQTKWGMIISNKYGIYKLPQKLLYNFRLRILGN